MNKVYLIGVLEIKIKRSNIGKLLKRLGFEWDLFFSYGVNLKSIFCFVEKSLSRCKSYLC